MSARRAAYAAEAKRVYYLSLEFLIGRLLRDAVSNLELMEGMREALSQLGVNFDVVAALEADDGGRLVRFVDDVWLGSLLAKCKRC